MDNKLDIPKMQKAIIMNKIEKGFSVKSIEQEFLLMHNEMSEAYSSYLEEDRQNLGEELADIAIYLMGIAECMNFDLEKEIMHKFNKNKHREYKFDNKGHVIGKQENAV